MPTHIIRLMAILVVFLVAGYAAKQYFTPDSFYTFGHYRADYVREAAADPVQHQGPDSCQTCHADRHAEWSAGSHRAVKCEACHGPAGAHPASGKLPVPEDSIRLCTLCHEATPGRPAFQPQIVVDEHPVKHDQPIPCKSCHNPHSPRIGAVAVDDHRPIRHVGVTEGVPRGSRHRLEFIHRDPHPGHVPGVDELRVAKTPGFSEILEMAADVCERERIDDLCSNQAIETVQIGVNGHERGASSHADCTEGPNGSHHPIM